MSFPVRTAQFKITVGGLPCSAITCMYTDRIMFVVSQLDTFGTVVTAQKETVLGGGSTFSTTTLLGLRTDPLPELCARQLAERLSTEGCDVPVLLCLGLKKECMASATSKRDLMVSLVNDLMAHPVWPVAPRQTATS